MSERLPVHGFVLAGGKSSRMGQDKALLRFRGRPMVEIAVEKLRSFCAAVSIVGEREDLEEFAPVVRGERADAGPGAGIEAGLRASEQPWAMFLPVDVPLVPGELLRHWIAAVVERGNAGCSASYLLVNRERQPAFCAVRKTAAPSISAAMDRGERRVEELLAAPDSDDAGWLWACNAERFAKGISQTEIYTCFSNVNTPGELVGAELLADSLGGGMKY